MACTPGICPQEGLSEGDVIEVIVRHAIRGNEIKVLLPGRAKFRHVKKAISRLLDSGDDLDFLDSGVLLNKDSGTYTAYKEGKKVGDVRKVLVCLPGLGCMGNTEVRVDEDELSEDYDEEEGGEEAAAANDPPVQLDPELLMYRPPPRPARKSTPPKIRSARDVLAEKARKHLHVNAIQKDVLVVVGEEFMSDNAEGEEVLLRKGQRGVVQQIDDPHVGVALIRFTAHSQPQWVFHTNYHRLGIAEEFKEDTFVVVTEEFMSDSITSVLLTAGQRGKVTGVDEDGDATIAFDAHDQEQWVSKKHFDMLRIVSGSEAKPLSREEALSIQSELLNGFSESRFQHDLKTLQAQLGAGEIRQVTFGKARQALFMRVQGTVLPKYGFEASGPGVIKMMSAFGSFVKDPEIAKLHRRVNSLLGLEVPQARLGQLADDCGAVAHCRDPDPLSLLPPEPGTGPGLAAAAVQKDPAASGPVRGDGAVISARGTAGATAAAAGTPSAVGPSSQFSFRPWPTGELPPARVFIVGSWDSFKPAAMQWEGGAYEHCMKVGTSGCETFQLRKGRSITQTIYPSAADASAFDIQGSWAVQGPDDRGQRRYWKIGKHPQDKAVAGDRFVVHVLLDVHGNVARVNWMRS